MLHNLLQRRWYKALPLTRPEPVDRFNVLLTAILLLATLTLLATSVPISETLFASFGLDGGRTAVRLHILAAYRALVIVSVHLGLRWPLLMNATRNALGLAWRNGARRWVPRLLTVAIAGLGVQASVDLAIGARLVGQPQVILWDSSESVSGFLGRCLAIAGLHVAATYCGLGVRSRGVVRRVGLEAFCRSAFDQVS